MTPKHKQNSLSATMAHTTDNQRACIYNEMV